MTKEEKRPELIYVTDWDKYYPHPKLGTLRKLIFFKDENGFDKVVKKIAGRVAIDVDAYFEWIEKQNEPPFKR